ncbi:(2Fe-2S) ferredoxin domain-containing protein [Rubrivirga sp. S365]|uniref:(2Fe-2S) ferredoxin domain-containing protein n=1 Tax=Rubrivirga sp. S365 TaxID=3076080 RepID=UPI0028C756E8|nr:(2Fe-2S) ferredoxin domain-containing protein [Rubrivirga sp. S365]MDT7858080.1 (2Fe-2S) ferredoxin domain-containing protein [Rubrivirga sp. S365]
MEDSEDGDPVLYRCNGANCRKKKGKRLDYYINKYDLKDKLDVEIIGCNDRCEQAPVYHLDPDNIWFSEKDLGKVFKSYILNRNHR